MEKLNINEQVTKTLNSLDHLERVEGNPFLWTRIQAQLAKPKHKPIKSAVLAWSSLAIGLLLALNVFLLQNHFQSSSGNEIEYASQEYLLDNNSYDWYVMEE